MGLNRESRTVNVGRNAFSAFSNRITIHLLEFVGRKIFIQYIGVAYLGINDLFANVLTLLSLADLGLGTAMNVSLYRPIAEKDTRKLSAYLNYFKKLYYFIAAGVFLIGMSLIPFLKFIVNMDRDIPHLYLYYVVFVLKNAVSYLFVYKSSIIRADQKNYLVNRVDVITNSIRVLLQCISLILFRNYLVYILLGVAQIAAHNITISRVADKQYPFLNEKNVIRKEEKKEIFSDVSSVFLYKVAWTLLNGTDNILMSVLVGTIAVGLYSNYLSVTHLLEAAIGLLFGSLTASVGNLVAKAEAEARYRTYRSMQMVSFWLCAIACNCLFFLTQDFIALWYGKEYLLDSLTVLAIILNTFFSLCMRPIWTFREGTGMYRQIRYIMFVTAILNLIFSVLLGKLMGISGILFATSISKLLTYFWYEPGILFRDFFHKSVNTYYRSFAENFILMIFCGGISYFLLRMIRQINWLTWLLKAAICVLVVSGVYFLRYRKKEEFKNILERAKKLFRRATEKYIRKS